MFVQRAYKTELDPSNKQKALFVKACGIHRFAYNWGLARKIEQYKTTGKSDRSWQLLKDLNKIKDKQFPWMREVSARALQSAISNLDEAYSHFFRRVKNGETPGFPKFKTKKNGLGGFRLRDIKTNHVNISKIKLPRIGWVKLKEKGYFPTSGVQINSATIKEKAGRWFISLQVRQEIKIPENNGPAVSYDLGLSSFVHGSDNSKITPPKPLNKSLNKLKKLCRKHSKKKKGSNNRKRSAKKLGKLHFRVANQRKDFLHKLSTTLAKTKSVIVMEDLDVKSMIENGNFSRSISDVGWHTFTEMLLYKTQWYGSYLYKAPKRFPSTQMCSNCGNIKRGADKLKIWHRVYRCNKCNFSLDRDHNAACNLLKYYQDMVKLGEVNTDRSSEINACGEAITDIHTSLKQEPSIE